MRANLAIYYDNFTPASDMYLKYIIKTAEEKGVNLHIFDVLRSFYQYYCSDECDGGIALLPSTQPPLHLEIAFSARTQKDVDGISNKSVYESATATGIFNHIKESFHREAVITVIGRGKVGSVLTKKLIEYGYTVISTNSKTSHRDLQRAIEMSSVVVGLSSQNHIVNDHDLTERVTPCTFIDAGKNFDVTKYPVLRCGKWTREELFERVLHNYANRTTIENLEAQSK